jgi:hypothetical protein
MIIGISDGVGMTNKVGQFRTIDQAINHYESFYIKHYNVLKECWGKCSWEIVKTTGDGLFFYSKNTETSNCIDCLDCIIELHKAIDNQEQRSRLFLYFCDSSKVVFGDKMTDVKIKYFLEKDLFGHQLNFGFRLLGLASGPILFTEEKFLEKIYPDQAKNHEAFIQNNINYVPIPVTYLKGISEVGFRSKTFNQTPKNPHWIWEVKYSKTI